MPYLQPKFLNDIFLSYARVDNQTSSGSEEGWVNHFKKSLEIELSKLVGRVGVVRIWMDTRDLSPLQYFDIEIENQIRNSGIFIALTSPGYIHEDSYCRKELSLFYKKAQSAPESLTVGTRSRLVNALLYDIDHNEWPSEIKGLGGAPLFDPKVNDPSRAGSELFDTQVKLLARDIYKLLSEYKKTFTPESPKPPEPSTPTVFLADTVESLSELRGCVINALQREGITVSRRFPPPYELEKHDDVVVSELRKAELSVHLFDAAPGEKLIDGLENKTFLQRQAELGLEHAKSQFIWMPPPLLVDIESIKDEGYRSFITQLEKGERNESHYKFVRDPASDVPQDIVERIKELRKAEPRSDFSAALLETHRKDQLHALDLYPLLVEKALQPYINPEEDDPRQNFERFEELVREISILIIIFGQVTSDWVRERLNSSLQLAGTLKPQRLKLCGIYAPPGEGSDNRQVSLGSFPGSIPVVFFNNPLTLAGLLDMVMGGEK